MAARRWITAFGGIAAIWLLSAGGAAPTETAATFPCTDVHETFCGDGGPAVNARMLRPLAIAARRSGGFFVADAGNDAVRMVLPSGVISTVAGIGVPGFGGDGGPANAAQLDNPNDVSPTADGSLLIADTGNNVIRRVSPTGKITTVAGHPGGSTGQSPSSTPTPAKDVDLDGPTGVAAISSGGYLIADTGANLVLRVSSSGLLTIVAGTGASGYTGDGGSARSATLNAPTRVLPLPTGVFLILDQGNNIVRSVSAGGTISSVAGSETTLNHDLFGQLTVNPGGLAVDKAGDVIVFDDRQVVSVSRTGDRTIIAGTGDCGSTGDGGPATDATLATPTGVAVAGFDVLVVDYNNGGGAGGNVRLITPDQQISTVAGAAGTNGCIGAGGAPSGSLWPFFYITAPRDARARRPIAVTFITTRASTVDTSLRKAGRQIRIVRRDAQPGRNVVTLPGVPAGRYTMRIAGSATLDNPNADEGGTLPVDKHDQAGLTVRK